MVRAAALASGDGARLQAILDSMYFKEIPNFELVAVISPQRDAYAMKRALNAGVPAYVVDPELFPTMTSHSMAIANKLRDMDIELVILAGYDLPLGVVPYQFKNRIIGTCPSLYPAFEGCGGRCVPGRSGTGRQGHRGHCLFYRWRWQGRQYHPPESR